MPITYRNAASAASVAKLEQEFGRRLPADYKDFLSAHDGMTIAAPEYCQIPLATVDDEVIAFSDLFGVDVVESSANLLAFNREFISEIAFLRTAIAIGEDGGGNPYVLMLEGDVGTVLYWDRTHIHVASRGRVDFPEVEDCGDLYVVAEDFTGFLALITTHVDAAVR